MASVSGSRRTLAPCSGGKILRPRRSAGPRTPYDRPRLPDLDERTNPNWISRLVLSPSRAIATGAGKLISAVFSQDDDDSDSDSDSSSILSEGDSASEGNVENDLEDNDFSSQRDDILEEMKSKSEFDYFEKDPEPTTGGKDTKREIAKLIMQETFTREECKNLMKMIKSRVVDHDAKDTENRRLTQTPKQKPGDVDEQDLRFTAVMEARKWLSEKKVKSPSKSDFDIVIEDEVGSPADMAKSYMRSRPLWASPTFRHGEFSFLSPVGTHLFKEDTPHSFGATTLSSSKAKRDWNIQEEIQRVRAKATEDMLSTLPSKKIDWSSLAPEERASPKPLLAENLYSKAIEKLYATKSVDSSFALMAGGLESSAPSEVQGEASLPNDATIISEKTQGGLEGMECDDRRLQISGDVNSSVAGVDVVSDHIDVSATEKQNDALEETALDPRPLDTNCSTEKEGAHTTNGSRHSLSEEVLPERENCVLLSEISVEVLTVSSDAMDDDAGNDNSPRYATRKGAKRPSGNDDKRRRGKTNKKKLGIPL